MRIHIADGVAPSNLQYLLTMFRKAGFRVTFKPVARPHAGLQTYQEVLGL